MYSVLYLVNGWAWAEWILAGQQGRGDDDADQDKVPHDGMTLQPVAEDAQAVVLNTTTHTISEHNQYDFQKRSFISIGKEF